MDRRSLLKLSLAPIGYALTGCQADPTVPQILGLKGSIPPQVFKAFKQSRDRNSPAAKLLYQNRGQMGALFEQLQNWQRVSRGMTPPAKPFFQLPNLSGKPAAAPTLPELVTLGDAWLPNAIAQGLIQPLDVAKLQHWGAIDDRWKQLVSRNDQGQVDAKGKVWGVPYRWGGTVIAYRKDLLAQQNLAPPQDWADLLRPEFKGRISLLDSARETIGLVVKMLGKSYNSSDLKGIAELETKLQQLHQQAKFYSSGAYIQPLILGHTWLAVGWSSDLLPQLRTQPDLAIVVPQSGTALWADLWVQPQGVKSPTQDQVFVEWLDFCLSGEISQKLAVLSRAGSPLTQRHIVTDSYSAVGNPLLNLAEEIWQKSEPLQPLAESTADQYRSLWAQIRR
jgi:putative spermidine/putrescine transport system substrate-binding protein